MHTCLAMTGCNADTRLGHTFPISGRPFRDRCTNAVSMTACIGAVDNQATPKARDGEMAAHLVRGPESGAAAESCKAYEKPEVYKPLWYSYRKTSNYNVSI